MQGLHLQSVFPGTKKKKGSFKYLRRISSDLPTTECLDKPHYVLTESANNRKALQAGVTAIRDD